MPMQPGVKLVQQFGSTPFQTHPHIYYTIESNAQYISSETARLQREKLERFCATPWVKALFCGDGPTCGTNNWRWARIATGINIFVSTALCLTGAELNVYNTPPPPPFHSPTPVPTEPSKENPHIAGNILIALGISSLALNILIPTCRALWTYCHLSTETAPLLPK